MFVWVKVWASLTHTISVWVNHTINSLLFVLPNPLSLSRKL